MLSPEKQPNRSRCCLGCGRRNHVLDGVQIPPMRKDNLEWEIRYVHGKWLAEIILLQQNPSFGETPDQVHFSCRKLCWKVRKYDVHVLCLTMSVYELFERTRFLRQFMCDKKVHVAFCTSPGTRSWRHIEGSVHKGSISRNPIFFRKRVFVFCKFYFVILPTRSGNCILIFTPLESSLKVLSNCVILKLLI